MARVSHNKCGKKGLTVFLLKKIFMSCSELTADTFLKTFKTFLN